MEPEVIKPETQSEETGCCFRSCGGSPCINEVKVERPTTTEEKLNKIQ